MTTPSPYSVVNVDEGMLPYDYEASAPPEITLPDYTPGAPPDVEIPEYTAGTAPTITSPGYRAAEAPTITGAGYEVATAPELTSGAYTPTTFQAADIQDFQALSPTDIPQADREAAEYRASMDVFSQEIQKLRDVNAAYLRGEISGDVAEQVRAQSAERALAGGIGTDSGAARSLQARDFGLTSMQLQEAGMARQVQVAELQSDYSKILQNQQQFTQDYNLRAAAILDQSRQFASAQSVNEANYLLNVQQSTEDSRKFAATYGLDLDRTSLLFAEFEDKSRQAFEDFNLRSQQLSVDAYRASEEAKAREATLNLEEQNISLRAWEAGERSREWAAAYALDTARFGLNTWEATERVNAAAATINLQGQELGLNTWEAMENARIAEQNSRSAYNQSLVGFRNLAIDQQNNNARNYIELLNLLVSNGNNQASTQLTAAMNDVDPSNLNTLFDSISTIINNAAAQPQQPNRQDGWEQSSSGDWLWRDPSSTDRQWAYSTASNSWEYTSTDDPNWTYVSETGEWRYNG